MININYVTREELNNIVEQRFVPFDELDLLQQGYFIFILYNITTNEFINCYSFDDGEDEYNKQLGIYLKNKNNYTCALFYDVDKRTGYCINTDFIVNNNKLKNEDIIAQYEKWLFENYYRS